MFRGSPTPNYSSVPDQWRRWPLPDRPASCCSRESRRHSHRTTAEVGSARLPGRFKDGPIPRTSICCDPWPNRIVPAIKTFSPGCSMNPRVETLASLEVDARRTRKLPPSPHRRHCSAPDSGIRARTQSSQIADSRSFDGLSSAVSRHCVWLLRQSSFMTVVNPAGPCSSRTGSANGLETPKALREGPMPLDGYLLASVSGNDEAGD